ncbi:MAG: GIY-YIG nuclease family protein [Gammaproteobacteria bacterium]|jgi:putative endonuclease|nr:GIY-YIG nuclease family protein [Gammaproteobacteria bacterium]MBT4495100.1 GIY-YIG nuclease family protein [Gammaproteobacteria bacterium]MBT7370887.1 GIY-YIG nuclease family protein [Gammaproteobacteria bacterium]
MYWVYILTNKYHTTLYVGVTNNIQSRVTRHKTGMGSQFTSKYRTTKLVFAETSTDPISAIEREKQIKRWSRKKKDALIESVNPNWEEIPLV